MIRSQRRRAPYWLSLWALFGLTGLALALPAAALAGLQRTAPWREQVCDREAPAGQGQAFGHLRVLRVDPDPIRRL